MQRLNAALRQRQRGDHCSESALREGRGGQCGGRVSMLVSSKRGLPRERQPVKYQAEPGTPAWR
jgi:hypothetical protein